MEPEVQRQMLPEDYNRLARVTLLLAAPGALLSFVLAAVQGADWRMCFLLAGVTGVACLGAAALIRVRGSKAAGDAAWIAVLLRLIARR
ncbi:hypothetical protein [Enterovirga rhinocerotis]|uniref:Uncharacterized protein n=1 Tax=Enterovirga rhinocerotis TaxID=1339210 RepID=A0A4R7C751_9HYPH|nr:hypothetical protein [Enterovirga rhinocerotis]TDR94450.1 hypothetical protein EV668_1737 [Enterovirga rhinocerotis]